MGSLSLTLSGYNSVTPGTAFEVRFAQGQSSGNTSLKKVLFYGLKTSAGSATTDSVVYPVDSEGTAISLFGAGSKLHRAIRRFMAKCKSADVYAIAAAESAGVVATDAITPTGTASGTGVITYTCCGEQATFSVSNGTTVAAMVAGLVAAINLNTSWPVVAVNNASTSVTINAKSKGTDGNHIRHRVSITSGITTTVAVGGATLASGATDEVYTTSLSTVSGTLFGYHVPCANPSTYSNVRVGALMTQLVSMALPSTGIRQMAILASDDSASNIVTYCAAALGGGNQPQASCVVQKNSEWEPYEVAAEYAAIRYLSEAGPTSAWYNYDGYGQRTGTILNIPKSYAASDAWTPAELNTLIAGGATPIGVNSAGQTYIVQACTCSTDVRVRDVAKVAVAYKWCDDLAVRYGTRWSACGLQDDPANTNVQLAPSVCTPSRLKSMTIAPQYVAYTQTDPPMLDSDKTLDPTTGDIVTCATGIDPLVTTAINARTPLHVLALCHQFRCLVTENSSG